MAKRKSNKNKEHLTLGLVSIVLVVAIFAATIGNNGPSGHSTAITYDSTGSIWECSWDSQHTKYRWENIYGPGAGDELNKYLSRYLLNCQQGLLDCKDPQTEEIFELEDDTLKCESITENTKCICRGQTTFDYPAQFLVSN